MHGVIPPRLPRRRFPRDWDALPAAAMALIPAVLMLAASAAHARGWPGPADLAWAVSHMGSPPF